MVFLKFKYKIPPLLRKTIKVVLWLVISVVLLVVFIVALIQVPGIQNKIAQYATSFVSNKTQTRVEIRKIRISFPKSVVIEGIYLEDIQKDTLLYAGKVKINIALFDLFSQKISISSAVLEDVNLHLYSTVSDSHLNLDFLLTAFTDTASQKKVKPQSTSKWTFSLDQVRLKNIRFRFDDEYGGINIAAVLGRLELEMDETDFAKSVYSIDELLIESLAGNLLILKKTDTDSTKSDASLPIIAANKIEIKNSNISFADSVVKRSIVAAINQFELTEGSAGLDHLIIKVKGVQMNENSFAYDLGDKPESVNAIDVNHLNYNHFQIIYHVYHYKKFGLF